MGCIVPKSKDFKALMKSSNLGEQSLIDAIKAWRKEDSTGKRETEDLFPPQEWLNEYKGSRVVITDSSATRDLWERDYQTPKTFDSQSEALDEYVKVVNLFGKSGVFMYTDTKGITTVGVYKQQLPLFDERGEIREEQPVQSSQELDILSGIEYSDVTVDSQYKGFAGTRRGTYEITLRKSSYTPEEVIAHLSGKSGLPYSDQKVKVLERLSKQGWPIERIKKLLRSSKEATSLILLHELSHRTHKDTYAAKDYLSEEALAAETRATREALERIDSIINPVVKGAPVSNEFTINRAKVQETAKDGVHLFRITPERKANGAAIIVEKNKDNTVNAHFEGLIQGSDGSTIIPLRDSTKQQMLRVVADIVPMGGSLFMRTDVAVPEDFSSLGFKKVSESIEGIIWQKEKITTADLHIKEHSTGYAGRTRANAQLSDITLALAEDFNTAGEKRTKSSAGQKYIGFPLDLSVPASQAAYDILNVLVQKNFGRTPKNVRFNIAGNSIDKLSKSQEEYDAYLTDVFKYLIEHGVTVSNIRSGGQTGIDEAGIKAAQNLGLNWEILAPKNYRYRNSNGSDIVGNKAGFIDRFNRSFEPVKWTPQESVEGLRDARKVYFLTELTNQQPFRSTKMVSTVIPNIKEGEREKHLLFLLNDETFGIGDRIVVDPEMPAEQIIGTVKALNSLEKYLVYGSASPIAAPLDNFSEDDIKAFKNAGFTVDEENGNVRIPSYSIGYTQYKLYLMQQESALRAGGLFKDSELRALAKGAIFKLSDEITKLNTNPERARELFADKYPQYLNRDYTQMSRIEILDPSVGVGLDNLLNILIKEGIFNPVNNSELQKKGFGSTSMSTLDKMNAIYNNFDAFIRMGYDALINLEQVSFIDGFRKVEDAGIFDESDTQILSSEDEQTIQEVYGSSLEHWQIGFRQVSAINSMAQQMKRELGKLYDLDKNGVPPHNEFGMPATIDAAQAVTRILSWTQGAENLDDMISMLQSHMISEPWLNQLVGEYHADGDPEKAMISGILMRPENDQFRSKFFSTFKKYFQMYAITYKKDGRTLVKAINTNSHTDNVLKGIASLASQYKFGALRIWDEKKEGFSNDFHRLDDKIIGFEDYEHGIEAPKGSLNDLLKDAEPNDSSTDEMLEKIAEAYEILDIQAPSLEELRIVFPTAESVHKFGMQLVYTVESIKATRNGNELKLFTNKGKNARSDYKKLTEMIAPVMSTNLEAVSYEAGKMHYGYVTPAYLGLLIEKLKGHTKDYRKFLQDEYLKYTGWFSMAQKEGPKGLIRSNPWLDSNETDSGILNWWIQLLADDSDMGKKDRERLMHIVSLSDNKVKYVDKSDPQFIASALSMYLYDDNGVNAFFGIPTMSNKESEEYIRFRRITENFEDFITHQLASKVFIQEVNRIRTVTDRYNRYHESHPEKLIQNLDVLNGNIGRGARFQFLDFLNKYLDLKTQGSQNENTFKFAAALRKYVSGKKMDTKPFSATVNGVTYTSELQYFIDFLPFIIHKEVNRGFEDFLHRMEDNGFLKIQKLDFDKYGNVTGSVTNIFQVADKVGDGAAALETLKEYFWNDMFASINILQLTISDLALYKDTEDVQKRLAQLHSPGIRGNVNALDITTQQPVTDGFTRTAYLKDSVNPSQILENLRVIHSKLLSNPRFVTDGKLNERGKAYKKTLESIIKAFETVNWADAQGYSSPTSYRKKMHVFGRWDAVQEAAYQAVLNGDFSEDNLNVIWQPLKPFVYTQIGKPNDTKTFMPNIKIGVQNKNSEYLLIIADALTRAAGEKSVLTAIFDVMEESARLHPSKGIDTIQFESTVKVGLLGAIDLNDLSYDEAVARLKNSIYASSKADKDADGYSYTYVHTLPFSDYAIQQEIPSHLTGEQQQGSQDRILSIADMADVDFAGNPNMVTVSFGNEAPKTMTVREAKDLYMQKIVENIKISADKLAERLGLNIPNEKLRNIALSKILQEQILKDGRYGSDTLWACSTDDNGNFNIPLSDPMQAGRIQQLLNSIIKNGINKQEVAGGPVVQVSSWGTMNRNQLHIKFKDAQGNILQDRSEFQGTDDEFKKYLQDNQAQVAYFECYCAVYDEDIIKDFGIKDKSGKFTGRIDVKKMERINPKLLQLIGYRIPTESKYSMVPLKIVGFLPRRAGEAVMMPAEITTLAGSDFDIDKLFIMRYAYRRNESQFNIVNFARKLANEYKARFEKTYKEKESFLMDIESFLSMNYPGSLTETQQQLVMRQYEQEILKAKYSFDNLDTTQSNNNTILDIHWGMLTSMLAADQFLSPGNFNEPKRVGYTIAALDNLIRKGKSLQEALDIINDKSTKQLKELAYQSKNIIFSQTKMDFHRQNMVAAKLIGVFAQANVSHGFIGLHTDDKGQQDVTIIVDKKKGFKFLDSAGEEHVINGNVPIDREYSWDGFTRISANLASLLAASVDAVKDPILNLMNINMITVNAAVALIRLGVDIETVGWMLSTPIIRDLVKRFNEESAKKGYVNLTDVISTMEEEISKDQKITFDENFAFGRDFFIEQQDSSKNTAQYNYNILELLNRVLDIAKTFRDITHMTRYNSITSAVGPFASNTMLQKMQDEGFSSNPAVSETLDEAVHNPILNAFRGLSYSLEGQLLGNLIQASSMMETILRTAKDSFGYMSNDLAQEISEFAMSYLMNLGTPVFNLSFENRQYMITQFANDFPALSAAYRDNPFIKAINRTFEELNPQTHDGIFVLDLKTKGMLPETIEDIRSGWAQLYKDEEQRVSESSNPDMEKNLALQLVEYNFFRTGFGFSPKTFINMAPAVVKMALPHYLDNINALELHENMYSLLQAGDIENLLYQFMLNKGKPNAGYLKLSDIKEIKPVTTDERGRTFIGKVEKGTKLKGGIAAVENAEGQTAFAYITPLRGAVKFVILERLGGDGRGFEINPAQSFLTMDSIFDNGAYSGLDFSSSDLEEATMPQESLQEEETERVNEEFEVDPNSAFGKLLGITRQSFDYGNPIESLSDILSLLARAGGMMAKTKEYVGSYKNLLERLKSGVSYQDIIDTINKQNLCG